MDLYPDMDRYAPQPLLSGAVKSISLELTGTENFLERLILVWNPDNRSSTGKVCVGPLKEWRDLNVYAFLMEKTDSIEVWLKIDQDWVSCEGKNYIQQFARVDLTAPFKQSPLLPQDDCISLLLGGSARTLQGRFVCDQAAGGLGPLPPPRPPLDAATKELALRKYQKEVEKANEQVKTRSKQAEQKHKRRQGIISLHMSETSRRRHRNMRCHASLQALNGPARPSRDMRKQRRMPTGCPSTSPFSRSMWPVRATLGLKYAYAAKKTCAVKKTCAAKKTSTAKKYYAAKKTALQEIIL
ncbi:hypothetical protein M011DRAFT_512459 [Sporormia fimetaria CBS 119925]|uniref:Uncharacterized protein n=1 Tax=Sporormia fimetaria CBS 119925 TaxID=1340428 RepID=A0A6A6UW18_9PLEO|nr:hypothetical protein M011DRAFT_512459 [Sporormia fimetaria CBS 119925]